MPTDKHRLEHVCNDLPDLRQEIVNRLIAFNESQAGPANSMDVLFVARGANDELLGGLIGYTQWNWLFVRILWVAEQARRSGLGSRLLKAAEKLALERGCDRVHLDTFDFQAPSFYQKHGYKIFGQLENYPNGHTRYFLQKVLERVAS